MRMPRARHLGLVAVPLLAALALPATTLAASITGTPGDDTLPGTASADWIWAFSRLTQRRSVSTESPWIVE